MALKRAPGWRDEAAGGLLARHADRLPGGRALVMEDPRDEAARALSEAGHDVERWWRRCAPGHSATAWPPAGPFEVVALRLPRAKEELEMAAHAGAGALVPAGTLVVYGAKDEGIGSAGRRLEGVMEAVRTLATGAHCRLLAAERPERPAGLRGRLEDWRVEGPLEGVADRWVSYPGVFAHGRLDRGTALLLAHLPPLEQGARILDFGCGAGAVAAVCQARARDAGMDVAVDGLDVDAVALTAFRENVPGAGTLLADGLDSVEDDSYTLVVSNPPYHRGKVESTAALAAFVADSPRVLAPGGRLVLVVQRRLPVKPMLEAAFGIVRTLAADPTYQVWEAVSGP